MNGAKHLYNDNWIVEFQCISSVYRNALQNPEEDTWMYESIMQGFVECERTRDLQKDRVT